MQPRDNLRIDLPTRRLVAAMLALTSAPCLSALNASPSPTLVNQCLALGLWGLCLWLLSPLVRRSALQHTAPLAVTSALVALGAAFAMAWGALPIGIGLGAAAIVVAAALVAIAGAAVGERGDGDALFAAFLSGLTVVGAVNALIACIQVFAPNLADGEWIVRSSLPGRGVGNLRQPNHLATLLLWSAIAVIALLQVQWMRPGFASAVLLLLLVGTALSGSRTGLLGTLLLAGWGYSDQRLSRASRLLLWTAPLTAWLVWMLLAFGPGPMHSASLQERLAHTTTGDLSSSRFSIWSNTLTMIARQPWAGVGFGEFNIAWTLTEFPDRPVAFFDHTHNLPLQLLIEFGVPLGALMTGLLLTAMVQAVRRAWRSPGDPGALRRAAAMSVLMAGLHSLLEYPLWYAYFLLPAAFAWGFALSRQTKTAPSKDRLAIDLPAPSTSATTHRTLCLVGPVMVIGAAAAMLDYRRVVIIYDPPDDARPLEERIVRGQSSPLFGHHADYAAATAFGPPKAPLSPSQELAFRRAPHQLLDVRLMIAWSQALASQGELDKARWLAARIREFRNPGADEYFAPCLDPSQAARAFQCQPPTRQVHWREFTRR